MVDAKVLDGTATNACDETGDALDGIKISVADCSYHGRGEVLRMQANREMP